MQMGRDIGVEHLLYKYDSIYNLLDGNYRVLIAFLERDENEVIKEKDPSRVLKRAELLDISLFFTKDNAKELIKDEFRKIFGLSK